MKTYFSKRIVCILLFVISSDVYSQSFLNGSFEINHTQVCSLNITNGVFDSLIDSIEGIGQQQTLDIFYYFSCSYAGQAEDGFYFSSLETFLDTAISSAISFKLSTPIISQNQTDNHLTIPLN